MSRPLTENPVVRWGAVAWAVLGLVGGLVLVALLVAELRLVVVPLALALFPAALLAPLSERLRRRVPDAVASLVVVVGFLVGVIGLLGVLGWLIAGELTSVVDTLEESYTDVRQWTDDTVNVELPSLDEALDRARDWAEGEDGLGQRAGSAAATGLEVASSLLFGIVALFFY